MFRRAIRLSAPRGYTKQCFKGSKLRLRSLMTELEQLKTPGGVIRLLRWLRTSIKAQKVIFSFFLKFLKGDRIQISFKRGRRGSLFNGLQSGGKYRNHYLFISNNTWRERSNDITAIGTVLRVWNKHFVWCIWYTVSCFWDMCQNLLTVYHI